MKQNIAILFLLIACRVLHTIAGMLDTDNRYYPVPVPLPVFILPIVLWKIKKKFINKHATFYWVKPHTTANEFVPHWIEKETKVKTLEPFWL